MHFNNACAWIKINRGQVRVRSVVNDLHALLAANAANSWISESTQRLMGLIRTSVAVITICMTG